MNIKFYFTQTIFKDIIKLSQMLEKIMQELFLNYFNSNSSSSPSKSSSNIDAKQQMRHVLKSYSLLAKQRLVEQLFTENKVKPFMEEVKLILVQVYLLFKHFKYI